MTVPDARLVFALSLLLLGPASCREESKGPVARLTSPPASRRAGLLPESPQTVNRDPEIDRLARFLAGRPTADSHYAALEKTEWWTEHSHRCNQAWRDLERAQFSRIRAWSSVELKEANSKRTAVFYPFAGPDFLYAHLFFPTGTDYILVGLEPPGSLPDPKTLSPEEWEQCLDGLFASLQQILNLTFFRTDDMTEQFAEEKTSAVLPILLFFLARAGQEVLSVERVYLDQDGRIIANEDFRRPRQPGAHLTASRIRFQAPGGVVQNVYYFSLDLSNYSLARRPGFVAFLAQRKPMHGFVKAASYLMHRPTFSKVRTLLLEDDEYLLQDDSGIPLEHFSLSLWTLRYYGRYQKPIPLFEARHQPRLEAVYMRSGAPALPFGVGYRLRPGDSNLMLAIRKQGR